jgi:germination protein M
MTSSTVTNPRRRHRRTLFLTAALAVALAAACSPTGGLGTVPPPPATPTPQPTPDASDETPVPTDGSPSDEPTDTPSTPPSPSPSSGPTSGPTATPTQVPAETIIVRAYGVLGGEPGVEGLVPTLHTIPATDAVARAAMTQLLAGDLADGVGSAVPAGTRLLGLTIRDGIAVVDLSSAFESGGGSASSMYRLGQVVYTLTQFSTVRSVLFQVEGRTVTTFGPEGIVLDGPQSRADYAELLPSVFVDRPAFEAAIGNPARISGNANVFEATFMVSILDREGRTIAETFVMADCGTGCRGDFSATVEYDVSRAQWGTLRVWVASARDGQPEDVRDYPVWLTPAS